MRTVRNQRNPVIIKAWDGSRSEWDDTPTFLNAANSASFQSSGEISRDFALRPTANDSIQGPGVDGRVNCD